MKVVMIARRNWSRTHLTLWGIILCALFSSAAHSQDQLPDLVRRIKPSAVAIETFDARGEKLSRIGEQSGRQHARPGYRRGYFAGHRRPKRQLRDSFRAHRATESLSPDARRADGVAQRVGRRHQPRQTRPGRAVVSRWAQLS